MFFFFFNLPNKRDANDPLHREITQLEWLLIPHIFMPMKYVTKINSTFLFYIETTSKTRIKLHHRNNPIIRS